MSWREFYVDLVDGPERGRRIKLAWGQRDFLVAVEQEIPCSPFDMPPSMTLTPPIRYRAMENGEIMVGQTKWGLAYRIEQWSVDGKRDEYERLFWQRLSEYSHM